MNIYIYMYIICVSLDRYTTSHEKGKGGYGSTAGRFILVISLGVGSSALLRRAGVNALNLCADRVEEQMTPLTPNP